MKKIDITNKVSPELRAHIDRLGARIYRLELGTLMVRNPDTLDTRFFLNEEDALGQLDLSGASPKRRAA
jgi:hypothetical protein